MANLRGALAVVLVACTQSAPRPGAPPPSPPPVALSPAADASVTPSPHDETPRSIPTVAAEVFAPAPPSGKLSRKRTAVLLVQDWPNGHYTAADVSLGDGYRFVPLVCSLDGKLAVGVKCGEAMPAKAKVRTAAGMITIARSTTISRRSG